MPTISGDTGRPPDPYWGPVPDGMRHVGWYCPSCHALRPKLDSHAAISCIERVKVEGPRQEYDNFLGLDTTGGVWYWQDLVDQRPVFIELTEEERYEQLKETH